MFRSVDLRLSKIPGENSQDEEENDADIEREEYILNRDVFFIVAELLEVADTQYNIELFSLFCFEKALNPVDVEDVLHENVEALDAEDDLAQKGVSILPSGILELHEEATHNAAQQD